MPPPLDGYGGRWGLSALSRVPRGLAVFGPALHEALGWRFGAAALLWRSPRFHRRDGMQPAQVAPLLAPLWDVCPLPVCRGGAPTPQSWTCAPQRRVLLIEGWDGEEVDSGGHWVGVTHDSTIRCLSWGDRPLATPPDLYAAAGAVPASIPRRYTPCGMRRCPPRGCPRSPRSTSTPAWGMTPQRGRRAWQQRPHGAGRLSRAVTQVCAARADVRRGHRDPPPPCPTVPQPRKAW